MNRSKRFVWEEGDLVPIVCKKKKSRKPSKQFRPYIKMSAKELTTEDLRTLWDQPGPKRIWKARARDAVDKTFKAVGKQHKVTHWDPIRFDRYYLRHTDLGEPKLRDSVMFDLEHAFWEQNAGWDAQCMDDALKGISRMTRRPLAKETKHAIDLNIDEWTAAWNEEQRMYAISEYGVDLKELGG